MSTCAQWPDIMDDRAAVELAREQAGPKADPSEVLLRAKGIKAEIRKAKGELCAQ